jgi:pyruvate,orthophosphate dikinase
MKQIYFYDEGDDGKNKKLLGGKGAGLCEMTRLKLPVPPGFVITTEVCKKYYENNKKLPNSLISELKKNIAKIEKKTGKKWNSKNNPEKSKNPRFAWDSYRRFIQLFGKVVFGVDDKKFDDVLENAKKNQKVTEDSALNEESLRKIVTEYKKICQKHTGKKFPSDPYDQVELAIKAVFGSWMGERAIVYRRHCRWYCSQHCFYGFW